MPQVTLVTIAASGIFFNGVGANCHAPIRPLASVLGIFLMGYPNATFIN